MAKTKLTTLVYQKGTRGEVTREVEVVSQTKQRFVVKTERGSRNYPKQLWTEK